MIFDDYIGDGSCCVDETPDKSSWRRSGVYQGSQFKRTSTVGKAWYQKDKAATQLVSVIKKWMQAASFFLFNPVPSPWDGAAHIQCRTFLVS